MTDVCVSFTGIVLVPLASSPVTGPYTEESGSVVFFPSSQVFLHIDKIPLSLLFSGLKSPGSLSFSSYDKYFKLSDVLVALCWTHFSKKDYLPQPPGNTCPNAAQGTDGHLCWPMVSLLCTRMLRAFSAKWKIPWEQSEYGLDGPCSKALFLLVWLLGNRDFNLYF